MFVQDMVVMNLFYCFQEQQAMMLMLTMFSAVAQQELYNTSGHVKLGQKMKMKKGELVRGC